MVGERVLVVDLPIGFVVFRGADGVAGILAELLERSEGLRAVGPFEIDVSLPDDTVQDPRERRAILLAVCIALMAVIAAVTGLNVAQPPLAVDLDASVRASAVWALA